VTDFCGLEWTPVFLSRLEEYKINNANDKWETELSRNQKNLLESVLGGYLQKFGY
jgi:hypothetical protein